MRTSATYVEEESAVDHLVVGSVWEVQSQLLVLQRQILEVGGVELLVARDVDGAQIAVGDELLATGEGVAHELHRAVVVGRQVQLALDGEDDVQVLLRLHEVAQVGRHDPRHPAGLVSGDVQRGADRLLLLLMPLLLPLLLEGFVVVICGPDEVRDEGLTHQTEFVLHHDACFIRFHCCSDDSYKLNL